ncbi:MAG: rsbW [Chlamydiia bacterium]|nr:rsbW [Chlamydiia bacterium]
MQKTIRSELSELQEAIHFVTAHAERAQCSHDALWKIQLATEEALINIMRHGYFFETTGHIHIECAHTPPHFAVLIKDKGVSFNPTTVDSTAFYEKHGIRLIRSVMDEVRYTRSDNVNILTLIKVLSCS